MKKIYVILNSNAKRFRTGRSSVKAYQKIKYEGLYLFLPQNFDELQNTIKKTAEDFPDYICIGGGDGSIHLILSELLNSFNNKKLPPVLILKEGTMNNIARTIKLSGTGIEILKRFINAIKNDDIIKTERRDTIEINSKYCFLFGTGLITNFLKLAYSGFEKGFLRNFLIALITAREAIHNDVHGRVFNYNDVYIEADNKPVDIHSVSGILAGTVEDIAMGFKPLKDASILPCKFQILIMGTEPRKILLNIDKIKRGMRIAEDGYINIHASSLLIKQNGRFDYTMDGDLYTAENELFIQTGPAIDLINI